jgi:hypothetical protein
MPWQVMQPATSRPSVRSGASWYHQPVVWLGVAVFVASLAGCVWIIVAAARHADPPVQTAPAGVFGVPSSAHSSSPAPPEARP